MAIAKSKAKAPKAKVVLKPKVQKPVKLTKPVKLAKPQAVKAAKLNTMLKKKEVFLIDVRDAESYNAEHIAGAHNIPISELDIVKIPAEAHNKNIIVHCGGGKIRCVKGYEMLIKQKPSLKVQILEGGLNGWTKAGLPTVKYGLNLNIKNIPMQGQVRITEGLFIFLGVLIGYYVHPFLMLLALFGLGLIFAGISGYGLIEALLEKMPWNQHKPMIQK